MVLLVLLDQPQGERELHDENSVSDDETVWAYEVGLKSAVAVGIKSQRRNMFANARDFALPWQRRG